MKPIDGLDACSKAKSKDVFGTKMRSVIKQANQAGIDAGGEQQFDIGKQISAAVLVPIIEPEVDIKTPNKASVEEMLKSAITKELNALKPDQQVMLKLTIPEVDNSTRNSSTQDRVCVVAFRAATLATRRTGSSLATTA